MKVFLLFALALASSSASVLQYLPKIKPPNVFTADQNSSNVGIINGHNASPGQFPYQVGLILNMGREYSWCGGSLLSNEWVLTAAHCTKNVISATVLLGTIQRSKPLVWRNVNKNDIIIHEHYTNYIQGNDISLIRIQPVEYSNYIQPVKLPKIAQNYQSYAGNNAVASGWGDTHNYYNPNPDVLQYGQVQIMENTYCRASFPIFTSHICIVTNYASTCSGDSGGPLMQLPNWVQIGITSYGSKNCQLGVPGVFTRVTSFLDWIKHHTRIPL